MKKPLEERKLVKIVKEYISDPLPLIEAVSYEGSVMGYVEEDGRVPIELELINGQILNLYLSNDILPCNHWNGMPIKVIFYEGIDIPKVFEVPPDLGKHKELRERIETLMAEFDENEGQNCKD